MSSDAQQTLLEWLAEESPMYGGLATAEAERLRAYVLASFEAAGLPQSALPCVIEELQTSHNSYSVAAAAKALRGGSDLPAEVGGLLLGAADRIRQSDDVVSFAKDAPRTTALAEIFRTFAWLGPRASAVLPSLSAMLKHAPPLFSPPVLAEIEKAVSAVSVAPPPSRICCSGLAKQAVAPSYIPARLDDVELQDQNGSKLKFRDFFLGQPTVLGFFYSRCMNPNKCSLTITRLGRLQERLRQERLEGRVNVAAVTYDTEFDLPQRLHAYGTSRGMIFDERNRLMRTTGPFETVRRHFGLGVGFGPTTVNQHRLDLFLLNDKGCASVEFSRVQWDERDLLVALAPLLHEAHASDVQSGPSTA